MATPHHPRVLILFLGGSSLSERGGRGSSVSSKGEIDRWLATMAEMDIIAATDGLFINNGLEGIGLAEWATTAEAISKNYQRYDGFVVTHQAATMPSGAVALSLMLGSLGKPVVLVSSPALSQAEQRAGVQALASPEATRLGPKANIINALQVAVSNIGEVVVVAGHQIWRGQTVQGPTRNLTGQGIGKIDFGVRFFDAHAPRQRRALRPKIAFEQRVALIEYVPGLSAETIKRMIAGNHGVFLSAADDLTIPDSVMAGIVKAAGRMPIVVSGQLADRLPPTVIVGRGDRSIVLIRFFWALGQSRQAAVVKKLMA